MSDFIDYYEVLGISSASEDVVIQAAYKALMRKYHPDTSKSADATARAALINAAYAVLSDPVKRAAYDAQWRRANTRAEPPPRASSRRAAPARQVAHEVCFDCRDSFPSRETIVVTEKVLSATRTSARVYKGTRGGIGIGGGSGATYSYKERTICLGCAKDRADAIARQKRRERNIALVCVAIILIAIYMYSSGGSPTNAVAQPEPNATSTEMTSDDSVEQKPESAKPAEASTAQDREASDTASEPTADAPPSGPEPRFNFNITSVAEAESRALESGKAETWTVSGVGGFSVPSSITDAGGMSCRNVYSTVMFEGQTEQSPTRTMCRNENGDWAERR